MFQLLVSVLIVIGIVSVVRFIYNRGAENALGNSDENED